MRDCFPCLDGRSCNHDFRPLASFRRNRRCPLGIAFCGQLHVSSFCPCAVYAFSQRGMGRVSSVLEGPGASAAEIEMSLVCIFLYSWADVGRCPCGAESCAASPMFGSLTVQMPPRIHFVVSYSVPKYCHECRNAVSSPSLDRSCETPHARRVRDLPIPRRWHGKCHIFWHSPRQVQENLGTMSVYTVEARSRPRFKLEVDISINSRTGGRLKGHTVDISESGIAAMLTLEAPLGEILELDFTLPCGPVMILAMVRQRNAFRYGFEFVDTDSMHEIIRRTCRDLAVDQSLFLPDIPVARTLATRKSQALAADAGHRRMSCG